MHRDSNHTHGQFKMNYYTTYMSVTTGLGAHRNGWKNKFFIRFLFLNLWLIQIFSLSEVTKIESTSENIYWIWS